MFQTACAARGHLGTLSDFTPRPSLAAGLAKMAGSLCSIHAYFQIVDEARATTVMNTYVESTKARGFSRLFLAAAVALFPHVVFMPEG